MLNASQNLKSLTDVKLCRILHRHDILNPNKAELKQKVRNKENVDSDENVKIRCEVLNKRLKFAYHTDRCASGDSMLEFNNKFKHFTDIKICTD